MTETFIKNFTQISKADTEIAGGKGASLGEMTQAGIPVPEGFVILSNAFDRFLEETDLKVEIDAVLDAVDIKKIHTVENASEKIKGMILSKEMPEDIKTEILKFYKNLDCKFVAVRSSATSEDSASAAWAGQLDSFLNTTKETLLENVKKCWASLFTPRAIFYRFEKKLNKDKISVAVVVQKMVDSEKSGIAFSVHPVTQDENQIIIEAGFGLGEAIVSGSITPDSYVVDKQGFRIMDINVNKQIKALYKKAKGGSEWKELGDKGKKQVLTEKEILELSKLIVKIENHYSFPCDIEWAKEKGKFYIVQSRPITTLTKTQKQKKTREVKKIYNRPLPIYVAEYWYAGDSAGMKKLLENYVYFTPLFIQKKGRGTAVYYDVNDDKKSFEKLFKFFENHPQKIKNIIKRYKALWKEKIPLVKKAKTKDLQWLFNLCAYEIFPMVPILYHLGTQERAKLSKVSKAAKNARYWNDKILYIAGIRIFDLMKKKFSQLGNKADYITIGEAITGKLPSEQEIKKRQEAWIYLAGKLYSGKKNIRKFLSENNIKIQEEVIENSALKIKGNSAYGGYAKGRVKTIFVYDDIEKIKKGDVIVSPMTTPDMLPALKKASAIITDEGGVTCHAAITARELKIPCIIGTRIATELLKDGAFVEIDAGQGLVNILKE